MKAEAQAAADRYRDALEMEHSRALEAEAACAAMRDALHEAKAALLAGEPKVRAAALIDYALGQDAGKALLAQMAAMRDALEVWRKADAVRRGWREVGGGASFDELLGRAHDLTKAARASDAGRPLLEEIERLRRELEQAQVACAAFRARLRRAWHELRASSAETALDLADEIADTLADNNAGRLLLKEIEQLRGVEEAAWKWLSSSDCVRRTSRAVNHACN